MPEERGNGNTIRQELWRIEDRLIDANEATRQLLVESLASVDARLRVLEGRGINETGQIAGRHLVTGIIIGGVAFIASTVALLLNAVRLFGQGL